MDTTETILRKAFAEFKPPPILTLSEWADKNAYLSPESAAEPGKWLSLPYQRGIMDAFTDPSVERISLMKGARVGYTKILNNAIGYHVHQDPCPILVVQPTIEDAEGYSKDEIAPMIRDTPVLKPLVADSKSRSSGNTILKKSFPGGTLIMVGANSPRGFRRVSARIVLFDETDGYPEKGAGTEGDQIMLGVRRSFYYWNRKIMLGSTPTIKGISRIEKSFNDSDRRYYHVPCPFCGKKQVLKWQRIVWPKGEPQKAMYECVECNRKIQPSKKRWMVENGEWIATKPFNGHAGFHIWAAYSFAPNAAWPKLAEEREMVGSDTQKLQTFINTVLGEPWEAHGTQPGWEALLAKCEPYKPLEVPAGGYVLTAGVDVQDNRLAIRIDAWGERDGQEENWCIFWGELFGDPAADAVWEQLDGLIYRQYDAPHMVGGSLNIASIGVDSGGHHTQRVYDYCRRRQPTVFALKGASTKNKPIIGRPSTPDVTWQGQTIKNGVQLWPVGTDTAKALIYSRLNMAKNGNRLCHFYIGLDEDFFKQLTAEKLVTKFVKGFPTQEWVLIGHRNEALDCTVYSYAAAMRGGLSRANWKKIRGEEPDLGPPPNRKPAVRNIPRPALW